MPPKFSENKMDFSTKENAPKKQNGFGKARSTSPPSINCHSQDYDACFSSSDGKDDAVHFGQLVTK